MKILAVDYGDARTGLACCDAQERLASPVGVLTEYNRERLIQRIAKEAHTVGAQSIVVGHPLNMNGSEGPRSRLAQELADALKAAAGLPVVLWDERRTTVSAIDILNTMDVRGKKRKAIVDAVAAVIILESYLSWRHNHVGETPG